MIITPAPAPREIPASTPPAVADPGGLARRSELDVDHDSRIGADDLAILERDLQTATKGGTDAAIDEASWRLNQARMHSVLSTASANDTIRGAITARSMPVTGSGNVAVVDAVRAIGQLDLSKLREAGVPLTAAFDYDDTLAEGDVFLPAMRALAAKGVFTTTGDTALRTALAKAGVAQELIERGDVNDRARLLTTLVVPTGTPVPMPGAKPVSVADAFYIFGDAMRGMDVNTASDAMH